MAIVLPGDITVDPPLIPTVRVVTPFAAPTVTVMPSPGPPGRQGEDGEQGVPGPPDAHTHPETDVTGLVADLAELTDDVAALQAGGNTYELLVQEVVDRQVADGRLQLAIGKRYQWNPGVGIPETDLSSGVQAKLNPASSTSGAGVAAVPPLYLGDRHVARDAGIAESKVALASDANPATPSRRTLGRGQFQAMPGNTVVPVPGTDVPPLVGGLVPAGYLPDGSVAGAPLDTTNKPQPLGVPTIGVSVRSSPADHVHARPATPQPADHGLIAWSFDPSNVASSTALTNGVLQLVRMWIPAACTITGVVLSATTAGAGLGNCFTALFDTSRNLLSQSANLATLWSTTTGDKKGDLAAPQGIAGGVFVYAGFWVGSGTSPGFARAGANAGAGVNLNLTGTALRFSTANTGLTTTAPSTAGAQSVSNTAYLVGLY